MGKQVQLDLRGSGPFCVEDLKPRARQRVLDKHRYNEVDFDGWWEAITDDAKEVGGILGIDAEHIYFSGFSSQGDGACFVGSYSFAKGARKAMRGYAPKDKQLRVIIRALNKAQRPFFYNLTASVTSRDRGYSHSHSVRIDVYDHRTGEEVSEAAGTALREALRMYMEWCYSQLEQEYDYLTRDEQVMAGLDGRLFNEDGDEV